jgi:hypothetical protein
MFTQCISCNLKYPHVTSGLCEFCKIVRYNNKSDVFNYVLAISELSQEDIIKCTYGYLKEHDRIPTPEEVDPSHTKVAVNPYIYRLNNRICSFKIFYTNCIDRNKIKIKKIGKEYKTEILNIDKYCSNKKDIKNIINRY